MALPVPGDGELLWTIAQLGKHRFNPVCPERSEGFDGCMRVSDPSRCSGRTDIDLICASLAFGLPG